MQPYGGDAHDRQLTTITTDSTGEATALAAAYRRLLAAARALDFDVPDPCDGLTRTTADWILAHLILYDELLVRTSTQVLAGEDEIEIDNSPTMRPDVIGWVIAHHTYRELVERATATSDELIRVVGMIPDRNAEMLVRVRLTSRCGDSVFDEWLFWRDFIRLRADEQVPAHALRLEQLGGAR